ncbi:MAG: sporulation protein YabP [Lachnospiraceae bacterium]|nr:sporulation protein YabP [Lachnospiraceae bacterium]
MGEIQYAKNHRFSLDNRKKATIYGITDVESFDTDVVVLVTEAGVLTIKGDNLHVIRLDVDKGELEMAGTIDSMVYSDNHNVKKTAAGILGRMFK